MNKFIENHPNLFTVKSIVTILMTLTFCVLSVIGFFQKLPVPTDFVDLFKIIVVFYFGAQYGEYKANKQIVNTEDINI